MRSGWTLFGCLAWAGCLQVAAQAPSISAVTPLSGAPTNSVLITGYGFSSTPANLQVWFDHVRGTILSSSDYSIEVQVPPQARLSNVEVINLATKLSVKSQLKFTPEYGGSSFDGSKVTAPLSFSATRELFDLCACDFDGDGKPDIAATKFVLTVDLAANDMIVLHNTSTPGNMAFNLIDKTTVPALDITAPTYNTVCGDLNGDGKPELVASRGGSTRDRIYVLRNTGSPGTISFATAFSLFLEPNHVASTLAIRDLNGDGKPEIVVTNVFNNTLHVFQNTTAAGNLSFNPTSIKITVTGATKTYGLDVQDMDGDDKPELIINPFQENNVFVLRNVSSTSIAFDPPVQVNVTGTLNSVTSADLNRDGKLDLLVTSTFNNQLLLFTNNSTGPGSIAFAAPQVLTTSNGPWGVDVSDIDGDSDVDLIVANRNQAVVNVFRKDNAGYVKVDLTASKPTRNVRVGDFDGDGKPDVAFTAFSGAAFSVDILRNTNCVSPAVLNDAPLSICPGQTIRLETTPALNVTFDWAKDGSSIKNSPDPFVDITASGTYTVTALGEGGACSVVSPNFVVSSAAGTVPADPTITSNAPLCTGATLDLTTTAVGGATYAWTGPNGFTASTQNVQITNVTAVHAGQYSLVISLGACRSNAAIEQVDIADLQSFSISGSAANGMICAGSNATLSVDNISGHTYQWYRDGSIIAGQTTPNLTASIEGAYTVRVTNTLLSCSVDTDPYDLITLSTPVSAFTVNASACIGEVLSYTNSSTFDNRGTAAYAWNFGDGQTSTLQNPTHSYSTANNMTTSLGVSYTGVTGCLNSSNKLIGVVAAAQPVITPSTTTACAGEDVTLTVSGGTFTSLTWDHGPTGSPITVNQPGTYNVTSVDGNTCVDSAQVVVNALPGPTLTLTADKTLIVPGESVQLTASGADTYSWLPVDGLSNPNIGNPVATPTATTTYVVSASITGGCTVQDSVRIDVIVNGNIINPPKYFTPNGDTQNDVWVIPSVDQYPECTMAVYDVNGRKVYERTGYTNDWNGTFNGNPVPEGTYYFAFGCPDGKRASGNVLIVR